MTKQNQTFISHKNVYHLVMSTRTRCIKKRLERSQSHYSNNNEILSLESTGSRDGVEHKGEHGMAGQSRANSDYKFTRAWVGWKTIEESQKSRQGRASIRDRGSWYTNGGDRTQEHHISLTTNV